jgi:hypothetical protein
MSSPVIKRKSTSKLLKFIKSIDIYGHPISLTYKSETTYKSIIGGFSTILSRAAILGYLASYLVNVYNNDCTINKSSIFRNTIIDNTTYYLNESNFDFAIILNN